MLKYYLKEAKYVVTDKCMELYFSYLSKQSQCDGLDTCEVKMCVRGPPCLHQRNLGHMCAFTVLL